ncbi:MAG: phytoene/squalene synthase family protein [Pseudomonadota bacterium]
MPTSARPTTGVLELSDADRSACRSIIRAGSKSFYAASLLLPYTIRHAASALYAFCRLSDDMVDEGSNRRLALKELRRRLDLAYAGTPFDHVADRAFAATVSAYGVPRTVPEALIEGYEWDVDGRTYETIDQLVAYSSRVAATVGVMMTVVMGRRAPHVLARAADLGVAMQLTNIARDVGEDARNGRIYLPLEWMREEGIDPDAFLADPSFSPALGRVVRRLLKEADLFYHRGATGLAHLPSRARPAICAAALIYRDIGREIKENDYDSVSRRAATSTACKIKLCIAALLRPSVFMICDRRPPHEETRFLVEATAERADGFSPIFGAIDRRMANLAGLIETIETRDRLTFESRRKQNSQA